MDLLTPLTTTVISEWQLAGASTKPATSRPRRRSTTRWISLLSRLGRYPAPADAASLVQRALNEPDIDVFSGVYCCRHRDWPAPALVYFGDDYKIGYDWTVGDLLTTGERSKPAGFWHGSHPDSSLSVLKLDPIPGKPWFHTSKADGEFVFSQACA